MVDQDRAQTGWSAEKPSMATTEPARRDYRSPSDALRGDTQRAGRRHMGVASSDPQYLPLTPQEQARERALAREQQRSQTSAAPNDPYGTGPRPAHPAQGLQPCTHRSLQHSERYLSTPKPGKTIFKSRYERQRRHTKSLLVAAALVAVAIGLVWFIFLR